MKKIKINSKIEMVSETGEKTLGSIFDIEDEHILISVVPGVNFKLFYPEDEIELIVYDDKNLYSLKAKIIDRESNDFLIYKLSGFSEIKKLQRRSHVRIPYTNKLYYSLDQELVDSSTNIIEDRLIRSKELENFEKAYLEDISGGGIRMRTCKKIEASLLLVLKISVEDEEIIVKGQVCHGDEKEMHGEKFYSYGIKFVNVEESKIEKIVKFVFLLMRTNRPV